MSFISNSPMAQNIAWDLCPDGPLTAFIFSGTHFLCKLTRRPESYKFAEQAVGTFLAGVYSIRFLESCHHHWKMQPLRQLMIQEGILRPQGERINPRDIFYTVLNQANMRGIEFFLTHYFYPDLRFHNGRTPLMVLANSNKSITPTPQISHAVHALLDAKACIEATDREGNTPLMLAAEHGNGAVLKLLLGAKANLERSDPHLCTALDHAAMNRNAICAKYLILAGAIINRRSIGANDAEELAFRFGLRNNEIPLSSVQLIVLDHFRNGVNNNYDAAYQISEIVREYLGSGEEVYVGSDHFCVGIDKIY